MTRTAWTTALLVALSAVAGCSDNDDGPAENLGQRVDDAVSEARDRADEARDRLDDAADEAREAADEIGDALRDE